MTPLALDISIGIIIALSTVIAYLRGIIKEIFTLLGLAAAAILSYQGGHLLVPTFNKWLNVADGSEKVKADLVLGILSPPLASKVFSYGGTFLFVFLIMVLLGYLLARWFKEAGLGIIDRLLGSGFGALRGFLLVFLFYIPCTYLIDQKKFPDWVKESFSAPVLQKTLVWTNKRFELDKIIEDRGSGIAIKFDKLDLDKLGAGFLPAEEELKKALEKEEKEIQKGIPDIQPDSLLNDFFGSDIPPHENMPPAPEPAPPEPAP